MTPAIALLRRAGVPFQVHAYTHDPAAPAYGAEAARALGVDPGRVLKTLVATAPAPAGRLVVAMVPVSRALDLKALAAVAGVKKAALAPAHRAERATGYVVGAISPLAQKQRLPTWLAERAMDLPTVFVSAGRRGLEVELPPGELVRLCRAGTAPLCR